MGATIVMDLYALQTTVLFSEHINPGTLSCYAYKAVSSFVVVMLFSIPLYELFFRPFLHNYIPSMLTRVGIGIILTGLSYIAFFSIDIIGQRAKSYTCLFDGTALLNINPLWTILPGCLAGLGNLVHAIAVYEFVFSQSPYNMKGLLMGTIYGISGVFHFFGASRTVPFLHGLHKCYDSLPHMWLSVHTAAPRTEWCLVCSVCVGCSWLPQEGERGDQTTTRLPWGVLQQVSDKQTSIVMEIIINLPCLFTHSMYIVRIHHYSDMWCAQNILVLFPIALPLCTEIVVCCIWHMHMPFLWVAIGTQYTASLDVCVAYTGTAEQGLCVLSCSDLLVVTTRGSLQERRLKSSERTTTASISITTHLRPYMYVLVCMILFVVTLYLWLKQGTTIENTCLRSCDRARTRGRLGTSMHD